MNSFSRTDLPSFGDVSSSKRPSSSTSTAEAPSSRPDYMERMQGFLAQQYDVNPAQGQAGEEQGGKGQQARSNFKPSTVQFDNGEYFRVDNNFQEKEVLYARSVSFFIEFQCAASQAEYHRKKRDLIDGGTKVDEEIKKFVQNWMLLRSFSQSKETDMKVPWLGSLKKEWTDHTAWVGLKDPCGQNKLKFFQNMQVSDHFGDYDFRIAGEQIFLYIGEAVLETFDQKETNFEAGMKWIVGDFTTINIKEVLFEGVVDATAAGTDDHHDEFDRFGKSIREKTEDERIVAEAYEAQVHKAFLLLLMYGIHFRRVKNMTLLEPRAIERARVLMYDRLQGSKALLDAVCKEYWELAKTNPGEEFTLGRGMLFHGPPGTGKTTLIGFLAQLVGITLITDLIPASSLRRSYVGETDHILIQFGMRAAYQPWRLCVLSLDEIETLVKKRPENAEKASDSSVNTLLALISGGSNVPTLHILGSTNMGNSIDAALLRRLLDGFFFVGLMNVQARTAMIEARVLESFYSWRINALDPSKESTKKKLYFVNDMVKDYFIAITMNLGGSHLQAILNRMLSTAEELHRLGFQNQSGEAFGITKQLCFENTRHVCAKQSLFLGDSYLCDYFRHNVSTVGADLMSSLPKRVAKLGIPDVLNLSGRILVNLRDSDTKDIAFDYLTPRFMFMEANYHGEPLRMNSNKNEMQPHQHRILQRIDCTIKNSSRPAMIQDIIVMCTKFCVNNDVDVLKVFGGAWLKQHSLSKEDEAMTKLSQEVFDCKEYKSVMFVFDIDSLIVSEYKPQDNDYANGNIEQIALWKGLLYQVLEIARTANVYVPPVAKGSENALDNDDETKEDHDRKAFIEKLRNESTDRSTGWQFSTSEKPQTRWVVFVTQNPSSLAAFQRAVRFPRTAEESINIANNEMMNEEKRCTVCDQLFCWAENEGGCRWHVPEAIIEFVDINKVPIGNLDTRRKAIAALSRLSAPEIQKGIWSCCKSSCTTFECSMRDAKHVRVSSNESDMKNVLSLEQEKEAIELCYPNIRLLDIVEQMEGASQSSSYRTTSDNRYEAGAGSFRPTHSFGFSNSEFEMDYEG